MAFAHFLCKFRNKFLIEDKVHDRYNDSRSPTQNIDLEHISIWTELINANFSTDRTITSIRAGCHILFASHIADGFVAYYFLSHRSPQHHQNFHRRHRDDIFSMLCCEHNQLGPHCFREPFASFRTPLCHIQPHSSWCGWTVQAGTLEYPVAVRGICLLLSHQFADWNVVRLDWFSKHRWLSQQLIANIVIAINISERQ